MYLCRLPVLSILVWATKGVLDVRFHKFFLADYFILEMRLETIHVGPGEVRKVLDEQTHCGRA